MLRSIPRGRLFSHPFHPIFKYLPAALWIGSLAGDVTYFAASAPTAARAACLFTEIGLLASLPAIALVLAEYNRIPDSTFPKRIATAQLVLDLAATALYFVLWLSRMGTLNEPAPAATTGRQLGLNLAGAAILLVSGYLGSRHAPGARPDEAGMRIEERKAA